MTRRNRKAWAVVLGSLLLSAACDKKDARVGSIDPRSSSGATSSGGDAAGTAGAAGELDANGGTSALAAGGAATGG